MVTLIRLADCPPQPWKNGRGRTRELYRLADPAGEVLIRLSIAELSGDQPFSSFPGIDRIIMQMDGPAMDLLVDGFVRPLARAVPFAFAGEAEVSCRLAGDAPAHDLNLMCRRSRIRPSMTVVEKRAGVHWSLGLTGGLAGAVALAPCTLLAGEPIALETGDALVVASPVHLLTATDAHLALWTAAGDIGLARA